MEPVTAATTAIGEAAVAAAEGAAQVAPAATAAVEASVAAGASGAAAGTAEAAGQAAANASFVTNLVHDVSTEGHSDAFENLAKNAVPAAPGQAPWETNSAPAGASEPAASAEQGAPELSRGAQIASIEASLREGEAKYETLIQSGASKEDIAAAEQNLGALEQQRNGLRPQAEPSPTPEADKPAGAPEPAEPASPDSTADTVDPNPQPEKPDKNLPIADRLSSAKSVRDAAEEALDKAYEGGASVEEIRNFERTFRKAESQYRDIQAESDRTYADQRLSSMEQRLNIAFEAKLTQVIETIARNNTEAFTAFKKYVDEQDPKKKEPLWVKVLIILAAVGKELFKGADVGETIQQPAGAARRQ